MQGTGFRVWLVFALIEPSLFFRRAGLFVNFKHISSPIAVVAGLICGAFKALYHRQKTGKLQIERLNRDFRCLE